MSGVCPELIQIERSFGPSGYLNRSALTYTRLCNNTRPPRCQDMRPLDDAIHITFANGERAEARGIGSVQLGGLTGAAFDHITLKDVLYVPEASVNLVSVPLAVRRGIVFDFAEEGCSVSKGGQLVTVAPPSGGVYVIGPSPGVAAALSAKATPQLWHQRYGHRGYDNMAKLQTEQLVDGIEPSANNGKVIVAGDVAFNETKGGAQPPKAASVAPKDHVRVAVDSDSSGSSGEDNGAAAGGDSDDNASDNGADNVGPAHRCPTRERNPPRNWGAGQQALQVTAAGGGDPTTMAEALASDDAQHWQAMDVEAGGVFVIVYVDDMLIAADSMKAVDAFKETITAAFNAHDLGEAAHFLGMAITRDRRARTIKLDQKTMAARLVSKYGLDDGKPRGVPLSKSIELSRDTGEPLDKDVYPYTHLVGSMLYMSVCTRPDVAQAVGALSKIMAAPTTTHWQAATGVLRYLAGSKGFGITYGASAETIVARKDVKIAYVQTNDMLADILTKPVEKAKLDLCNSGIGMG